MKNILTLAAVCCFAAAAMAQETQVGPSTLLTDGGPSGGGIAGLLWDNGDTDGSNGYSHFGNPRRTILDDFVLEQDSILQDFHTLFIWSTPEGFGTGYELNFRSNINGTPGGIIAIATNTVLTETATGRVWFDRAEQAQDVTFDDLPLPAGHYWIEMRVIGAQNGWQMVRQDVTLNPSWVYYEKFGGLRPGRDIFGEDADMAFSIGGIPEPTTLILLGLGGLVLLRRRR